MKHFSLKAIALAAVLATTAPAQAVTLNIDGGWDRFSFGAVGSFALKVWDFTLGSAARLSITDGFFSGDQFDVMLNGVSAGLTSAPVQGLTSLGQNYDAAFADPDFSSRSFLLAPGAYTLRLLVTARSGTDTRLHLGAVRLDTSPIPVPATGALLLSALGIAVWLRRRRTT